MKLFQGALAAGLLCIGCVAGSAAPPGEDASDREAMIARIMAELDLGQPYLDGPFERAHELVGPPPPDGSGRQERDVAMSLEALSLKDSPRWTLATIDADLRKGKTLGPFSCAAGIALSDEATPATAHLLRRTRSDFGASTGGVKRRYQRPRPFMSNGQPSCTPEAESLLRQDGSYPSGHAAIGFGTGLLLGGLIPERRSALVARGIAYGVSRRICNVHWASDTEASQVIALATISRLWESEEFRVDFAAARAELASFEAEDLAPDAEACAFEAAALGVEELD